MRFNPETGELEDLVAPSSRRASPSGNGPAPSPSPPPTASAAPSSSQVSPSGNGGLGQFIAVGLLCLLIVFVESESVSSFISSTVSSLFELVSVNVGESGENKEKNPLGSLQKSPKITDASDTTPAEPIEIRRALPIGEKSSPLDLVDKNSINISFVVRGLTANDVLNVRTGSSARYPVVAKLPNGARGIHLMGESVQNGETLWVLVRIGSVTGWVNRQFLVAE